MRVFSDFSDETPLGVVQYVQKSLGEFDDFDESTDLALFNGYACTKYSDEIKKSFSRYERKALLALWSPCEFYESHALNWGALVKKYAWFDDVYCVCPFTVKVFNKYYGEDKFKYIPYPFTNYSVNRNMPKEWDVCWFGGVYSKLHEDAIKECKDNFKYRFSSLNPHPLATDIGLSPEHKLQMASRCTYSLGFNILSLQDQHRNIVESFRGLEHEALKLSHWAPQFKVRTHEAASSWSIPLVWRDQWNLIDDFYEAGVEYLSFGSIEEMSYLINRSKDAKQNKMAVRAYKKSQNYTVEKVMEYITTNDPSKITWSLKNVQG